MADIHPDVLATAIRHISETTPVPLRWKVGPQASLKDDLCLDNLDRLTIACAIDEDLSVEIDEAAIAAWETVADIVATADRLAERRRAYARIAQPNYERLGLGSAAEAEGRN